MARYLRARGGFATRATLVSAGVRDRTLREQVRDGLIVSPRRGWYAAGDANGAAMDALRTGGRLACVSALGAHGVWVLDDRQLHVACARGRGARHPGVRVHTGAVHSAGSHPVIEEPLEALERLSRCATGPAFIASADSAIHLGLVSPIQLKSVLGASARSLGLLRAIDGRSESGIESLARVALRGRRVQLTPQVDIAGVGRVDLLVGDRLVIELDSWTWHSTRKAFEGDRRRDLALAARGYLPIRVSYRRVVDDWEAVEADLVAIIRRGDHRGRVAR